jgi:hypothetical protein
VVDFGRLRDVLIVVPREAHPFGPASPPQGSPEVSPTHGGRTPLPDALKDKP